MLKDRKFVHEPDDIAFLLHNAGQFFRMAEGADFLSAGMGFPASDCQIKSDRCIHVFILSFLFYYSTGQGEDTLGRL